eukprot:4039582-Prorocentrum_lima.AAC.1
MAVSLYSNRFSNSCHGHRILRRPCTSNVWNMCKNPVKRPTSASDLPTCISPCAPTRNSSNNRLWSVLPAKQ